MLLEDISKSFKADSLIDSRSSSTSHLRVAIRYLAHSAGAKEDSMVGWASEVANASDASVVPASGTLELDANPIASSERSAADEVHDAALRLGGDVLHKVANVDVDFGSFPFLAEDCWLLPWPGSIRFLLFLLLPCEGAPLRHKLLLLGDLGCFFHFLWHWALSLQVQVHGLCRLGAVADTEVLDDATSDVLPEASLVGQANILLQVLHVLHGEVHAFQGLLDELGCLQKPVCPGTKDPP
mmetsp:Transcript_35500/g.75691  ORF Transcript_35500/g.75691 Transcript_35500/m.75691 type:complete len:240 (-) Transcript_35500:2455-3174(-)